MTSLARGPMGGDSYTQIHRLVFRDRRLTFKAKGLFGLLSTHTDDWKITVKQIAKEFPEGVSALTSALDELKEHYYVIQARERSEDGTLGDAVWFYTDLPAQYLALGITDPEKIREKVHAEFDNWRQARDKALFHRLSTPGRDEPGLDHPGLDYPDLDDQPHKKRKEEKESKTEEEQQDLFVGDDAADTKTDEPSPSTAKKSKRDLNAGREDVERVCNQLAELVGKRGVPRPNVTRKWRDAARLLLDRDGYTVEQVQYAINWSHDDVFWRSNILCMPTLRKHMPRLVIRIKEQHQEKRGQKPARGGFTPYRSDPNQTTDLAEYLRRKGQNDATA